MYTAIVSLLQVATLGLMAWSLSRFNGPPLCRFVMVFEIGAEERELRGGRRYQAARL
jgi:hypothetical protein